MGKTKEGTQNASKAADKTATSKSKASKVKGEPVQVMKNYFTEMLEVGITEVPEAALLKITGYARHDSTGFRKATKTLMKDLGLVEKLPGKKYALTEQGRKSLVPSAPEPKTNEENHAQLKEKLLKYTKAPTKALHAIWDLLMDGEVHTREELLKVADYKRPESTGYRQIMTWLNKLELLDKPKLCEYQFSNKVFPFGRPN